MNSYRRTAAFTLIELLVVVAILALLIAILIPALGAARAYSKKTATMAQMHGIATACESYYQRFNAYPGVLSESGYDGGATPTIKFSSSQALMVSLGRNFVTGAAPTAPPTYSQVTAAATPSIPQVFFTCDNPAISPKDYSVGTGQAYDPLLNPPNNQLSPTIGVLASNKPGGTVPAGVDVPVIIDSAYGADAMPILYYRAARKYDPSVQDASNRFMNAVGDNAVSGTAPFAAFYSASNDWVFDQQSAASGAFANAGSFTTDSVTQSANAGATDVSGATGPKITALRNLLFKQQSSSVVPVGDFVLISAGTDRIYGSRSSLPTTNPSYNANLTTADDLVVAGGN